MSITFLGVNAQLVARSFQTFAFVGKKRLTLVVLWNTLIASLDLFAIALIGLLATLSLGNGSSEISNTIKDQLSFIGADDWNISHLIWLLAIGTAALFLFKTLLTVYCTRKILHFLSTTSSVLSTRLVASLLSKPITALETRTSHETLFLLTRGVEVIGLQILATFFILISDVFLSSLIFILVFFVDPPTAIFSGVFFGLSAIGLNKVLHSRASLNGKKNTELNVLSNQTIMEIFQSYRELVVGYRRNYYIKKVGEIRSKLAFTSAELSFLPFVSKYIMEFLVVFSAILISGFQILIGNSETAIQTMAIFLAAGTRLAPAVLRIQQSVLQIKSSEAIATATLDLIDSLAKTDPLDIDTQEIRFVHEGFEPMIELINVTYRYPASTSVALDKINLAIDPGERVAIVGPSGAGKSTLVDLILGIISPISGVVKVSGKEPLDTFKSWPGAIAYVPQNIFISNGTVRENLALGFDAGSIAEDRFKAAISAAALREYVESLDFGLDTSVGESGVKMSGGQRQRLGIARAMMTNPRLIVLDEATSSLDGESEEAITKALKELGNSITTIIVAHRLSTVKDADRVVYVSDGRIISVGSFQQVRNDVADFDYQAKLMGL